MTEETSSNEGRKLGDAGFVKKKNRLFVMINGWAGQEKESDRRDFRENIFSYLHGLVLTFPRMNTWIGWRERWKRDRRKRKKNRREEEGVQENVS